MSFGLTPRLQELVSFIRSYLAANDGIAPSYAEMAAAIGLRSKSGVARMVNELEARGIVAKDNHIGRSVTIVDQNAAAVMAERERCALIADDTRATLKNGGAINACKAIAAAIRRGPT